MIRKVLTICAVLVALVFGVLSQPASADHLSPAAAVPYTGPYTNMPTAAAAPLGIGGTQATNATFSGTVASTPAAAGTPAAGTPALAVTGAETTVLAYAGSSLIGFGALAAGAARRRR